MGEKNDIKSKHFKVNIEISVIFEQLQMDTYNLLKGLRWNFLSKQKTSLNINYFHKKIRRKCLTGP